ncbi:MAG TPA: hypothetical protein VEY94_02605 [Patescibacteria group bacterium]|nr:hypothetical protein [Patescibacteria group bacterium]
MTYTQKVAAYEAHAAMIKAEMADLVREGDQLLAHHHVLCLAFRERNSREYVCGADEFDARDEQRAQEILALMPEVES